ncbi:MFS transporter [Ceratobasidium theobromae]|uniref:MFS transporter n=1 Tax=Ceratobasidium theobromae TaxID=1582974 RepID=A0A5N5QDD4_9AGAM|nr:MFS transporter [Ceratobasidium theobromae]
MSPNSRSDVESTAPTVVDEGPSSDVDQVIAPGEEPAKQIQDEKKDPYLVHWDGPDDPANPKNWSRPFRWYLTALGGVAVLNATFASSAPSGIEGQLIKEYNLSTIVAILTISLFVVGYCVGPLLWGPLSENYGRRPIFLIGFVVYTAFQIGCALAPNTASILVFRFLGGTFAACPLTNSGAIIADIWDADTRGKALAIFTLAPFAGPALGPTVAGYMSVAGVSWRWLFWVLAIFAGVCTVILAFTLPETYAPIILKQRAQALRKSTGDNQYYSAIERENLHWVKRVETILGRPFLMFFKEPMLFAVTMYMSFIYGCVYLLFAAYPIVFTQGHHLNAGASGLMFLPLFGGGIVGVIVYLVFFNPIYTKLITQFAPRPVPPEYRLDMALIAGPLYALSFFWFGWTSYPSISYFAPAFSGALSGFSTVLLFLSLFNYIIDAYIMFAASALAISTVVRSAFGAGFPLFATNMYESLNPRIASTILGAIAILMVPIPFVLKRYGEVVRRKSKYAPTT